MSNPTDTNQASEDIRNTYATHMQGEHVSTFDERLDEIVDSVLIIHVKDKDYVKQNKLDTRKKMKQAIRTLIDEEVIGEDIDINARSNIYASKSGTEGLKQCWYDKGSNDIKRHQRKIVRGE